MPSVRAPIAVPTIEPVPPESEVPPITAVIAASNSLPWPRKESAEPRLSTWMVASSAPEADDRHEEDDLHPRHRHARGARRRRRAADGEDPVAELGLGQDDRAEHDQADPPEAADVEDLEEFAGEEILERIVADRGLDAADIGLLRDRAGEADRGAAQEEQAGEGDDEGRYARCARRAGRRRSHRRGRRRTPRASATHSGQCAWVVRERDDHAGEADHRPDREVELAGDEEKRHRRADDADLGGDVEIARDAAGGQEAAVPADEREEDPQDDQSDRGADLGPLDDAPRRATAGACANVAGLPWPFGGLPGQVARDRTTPIPRCCAMPGDSSYGLVYALADEIDDLVDVVLGDEEPAIVDDRAAGRRAARRSGCRRPGTRPAGSPG